MTPEQIFFIFFAFPDDVLEILTCDKTRGQAIVAGYLEAISRIREKELKDPTYKEPLTEHQYECLHRVICSREWVDARRNRDGQKLNREAQRILREVERHTEEAGEINTVARLNALVEEWGEAFCLCVDALTQNGAE